MARPARPNPQPLHTEADVSAQALIDEIDAEVKADNLKKFFQRYGVAMAAVIALIVLGTAAYSGYTSWVRGEQQNETALLIATMDQDPTKLKEEELKAVMQTLIALGDDGHGQGIRFAAAISEVTMLQKKGESEAAIKRLEALSKDSSISATYRDYALLQKLRMQTDKGEPDALLRELSPLMSKDNPWRISALQLGAILDAKAGRNDDAAGKLQIILDAQDTPMAAREEAAQLLRLYKAM